MPNAPRDEHPRGREAADPQVERSRGQPSSPCIS